MKEELNASELLLDLGVSVPVRPLRFLSRKRKPKRIVLRRPYTGTLIRLIREYRKIGVTYDEIKGYSYDKLLDFVAEHGKQVSEVVACTIVRGYFSYMLLHKIVAWWLRWRVHPAFLGEVMVQLMVMLDTTPFQITIRSVEKMNLMKPRLSH